MLEDEHERYEHGDILNPAPLELLPELRRVDDSVGRVAQARIYIEAARKWTAPSCVVKHEPRAVWKQTKVQKTRNEFERNLNKVS